MAKYQKPASNRIRQSANFGRRELSIFRRPLREGSCLYDRLHRIVTHVTVRFAQTGRNCDAEEMSTLIINWKLPSVSHFEQTERISGGFMKTDRQLQCDVLDELQYEPSVDASKIGVIVQNGIVSLSGTVANYAETYRAIHAAERVAGNNV